MTSVEFIEPMSDAEGAARAAELFKQAYGKEPAGVWAAPGRVNLIGGPLPADRTAAPHLYSALAA